MALCARSRPPSRSNALSSKTIRCTGNCPKRSETPPRSNSPINNAAQSATLDHKQQGPVSQRIRAPFSYSLAFAANPTCDERDFARYDFGKQSFNAALTAQDAKVPRPTRLNKSTGTIQNQIMPSSRPHKGWQEQIVFAAEVRASPAQYNQSKRDPFLELLPRLPAKSRSFYATTAGAALVSN